MPDDETADAFISRLRDLSDEDLVLVYLSSDMLPGDANFDGLCAEMEARGVSLPWALFKGRE